MKIPNDRRLRNRQHFTSLPTYQIYICHDPALQPAFHCTIGCWLGYGRVTVERLDSDAPGLETQIKFLEVVPGHTIFQT